MGENGEAKRAGRPAGTKTPGDAKKPAARAGSKVKAAAGDKPAGDKAVTEKTADKAPAGAKPAAERAAAGAKPAADKAAAAKSASADKASAADKAPASTEEPEVEGAAEAIVEEAAAIPPEIEAEATKRSLPPPSKSMSRKELSQQYQPYVRSIAGTVWKTLSKDIEFDDLVQYGMLGLYEAADRFDAKYGANFMTFAYYRIRGAIYDGLRGMGWVSRSEYQKHRFEQRANAYLTNIHDQDMTVPTGTGDRRTTDEEVTELANVVQSLVTIYVTALDAMEGFQIKDDRGPAIDESLELLQSRQLVAQAVEKLPEQERKLIQLYYYNELSLEEVGKNLGLSKSWTSRLHTRAIEKLSRLLKDLIDEYAESEGKLPPKPGSAASSGKRAAPLPIPPATGPPAQPPAKK